MNTDIYFERHKYFDGALLKRVGDLIEDVMMSGTRSFNLENSLYGLYDGVLYEKLVEYANEYPIEIRIRVTELYDDVHNLIHQ